MGAGPGKAYDVEPKISIGNQFLCFVFDAVASVPVGLINVSVAELSGRLNGPGVPWGLCNDE